MRADWQVRINLSHSRGFVGGAGRLLVHNESADPFSELLLLLPAALQQRPGNLRLLTAAICSAKPGMPANPGQELPFQASGAKVLLTVPLLRAGDWLYVDLTWDGGFPEKGAAWPRGGVPLGDFHPQVAVDASSDGRVALAPVAARYDVTLGTDAGATVRLAGEGSGKVVSHVAPDGQTAEHDFRSYGGSSIQAIVFAPGAAPAL